MGKRFIGEIWSDGGVNHLSTFDATSQNVEFARLLSPAY